MHGLRARRMCAHLAKAGSENNEPDPPEECVRDQVWFVGMGVSIAALRPRRVTCIFTVSVAGSVSFCC